MPSTPSAASRWTSRTRSGTRTAPRAPVTTTPGLNIPTAGCQVLNGPTGPVPVPLALLPVLRRRRVELRPDLGHRTDRAAEPGHRGGPGQGQVDLQPVPPQHPADLGRPRLQQGQRPHRPPTCSRWPSATTPSRARSSSPTRCRPRAPTSDAGRRRGGAARRRRADHRPVPGGPFGPIATPPLDAYGDPLTLPADHHHPDHRARRHHDVDRRRPHPAHHGDHAPRPRPSRPTIPDPAEPVDRGSASGPAHHTADAAPQHPTASTMAALTRRVDGHVLAAGRAARPGSPTDPPAEPAVQRTRSNAAAPARRSRSLDRPPEAGGHRRPRRGAGGCRTAARTLRHRAPRRGRGTRRSPPRRCRPPPPSGAAASPPARTRADTSWRKARSPTRATVGPADARATPRAVDTTPSIPLAPRLARTRGGSARGRPNASTSRTGMDDDTTRVASGGQPANRRWASAGSVSPTRRARSAASSGAERARARLPSACASSAATPRAGRLAAPVEPTPPSDRTTSLAEARRVGSARTSATSRSGSGHRPPGRSTTDSAPALDRRRQEAVDHLGHPPLAQAQDHVRAVAGGEGRRAQDAVGGGDDAGLRSRAGPIGGRPGPATPARRPDASTASGSPHPAPATISPRRPAPSTRRRPPEPTSRVGGATGPATTRCHGPTAGPARRHAPGRRGIAEQRLPERAG